MRLLPIDLHRSDRASATAQWTTLGRALEYTREPSERIVSDPLAARFLTAAHRRVLDGVSALDDVAVLGPVLGPAFRAAERSELTAVATSALCRHRVIDAALLEALPEVEQVVVLGAGYDTRAHRFARALGARPVFEVDLAPLSRRKAAIVASDPVAFRSRNVVRVETDFRTRPLRSTLTGAGVRLGAATFVVWEGVSMYLTQDAVRDTLDDLAAVCGPGTVLAMDFWHRVAGVGPVDQVRRASVASLRLIGEPVRFQPPMPVAAALLAGAGYAAIDVLDAARMTTRFATAGRRCDPALSVIIAHNG